MHGAAYKPLHLWPCKDQLINAPSARSLVCRLIEKATGCRVAVMRGVEATGYGEVAFGAAQVQRLATHPILRFPHTPSSVLTQTDHSR